MAATRFSTSRSPDLISLAERMERVRNDANREPHYSPMELGFYTTLVLEGAERSLAQGRKLDGGATIGEPIDLRGLVVEKLGAAAAKEYEG